MWYLDWYARLDKSGEEMLRWELVNWLSFGWASILFSCHFQSVDKLVFLSLFVTCRVVLPFFSYVSFQFWFSSWQSCFPSDHLLGRTQIKTPWSISSVSRLWNRESKWISTLGFFAEFINLVSKLWHGMLHKTSCSLKLPFLWFEDHWNGLVRS